jgi:catechol 2,3-dioxygenase-like lactoylglutathione lyase family enzyme
MRRIVNLLVVSGLWLGCGSAPQAQLGLAAANPIVYGHHHLNVTSFDAHQRLWVDILGGTVFPFGANEVVKLPNVLLFMREQAPTAGTKGSSVDHIGFSVPDLTAALESIRASGLPVITRDELPPAIAVTDGIAHIASGDLYIAFIMAPDEVKVELVEDRSQSAAAMLHHVHFAAQQATDVRDWYADLFGAAAADGGTFPVATLPGVALSYLSTAEPPAGTQGRSLDHIGFEIDRLEAFCEALAQRGVRFDRPYTQIPERGIALAFFTDPWGTYIELTEGLDKL